ncbi:MAG: DUF4339 domain-containing protein [Bdellovibrionales bacterium]
MQELYFHQLRNRDVGPLSAGQIRQMIRAGQIQSSDKIRVDGEANAYAARDFLAFRDEIERIATQENNGRRWVCMRARRAEKGSTSAMCGPYTRGEVVDLLLRNELSPSDYVWREGFTSWKTLDSVAQLRLPIPNFPRSLIPWNNGNLDWDTRQRSQPHAQATTVPDIFSERTLNAALILVCGLLAVVMWRLLSPHLPAFSSRSALHAAHRASTAISAQSKSASPGKSSRASLAPTVPRSQIHYSPKAQSARSNTPSRRGNP